MTRNLPLALLLFVCVVPCGTNANAQLAPPPQSNRLLVRKVRAEQAAQAMVNMPSIAPLFLQNAQFASTLYLVNEGNTPETGKLILLAADGSLISDFTVTVAGHDKRELHMADQLASAASTATQGSIELFDDNPAGSSLAGELVITYHGEQASENLDEELLMPSMSESHQLRGIAVNAVDAPLVSLSTPSMQPESLSVTCITEAGAQSRQTLTLNSHQSLTLRPCSVQDAANQNPLQYDQSPSGTPQAFGILIQATDPSAQIQAFGLSPVLINGVLGFAPIAFHDPDETVSNQSVYPGVPVGDVNQLWGSYAPRIAMQNFASAPRTVGIYQARTTSGPSTYKLLTTVSLSPTSVKTISIPNVEDTLGAVSSFQIVTDGSPADVDAQLWSEEKSTGQPLLFAAKDAQDDRNTGMHPWSTLNGAEDDLILYNQTASSQSVSLKIGNRTSLWTKLLTLAPHETRVLSPHKLAEDKEQDDANKPFALGAGEGEISWYTNVPGVVHGRLEHKDPQSHLVSSFQCAAYTVFCGLGPMSGPSTLTDGQSAYYSAGYGISCVNNLAANTCWGVQSGATYGLSYVWTGYNDMNLTSSPFSQTLDVVGTSSGSTTLYVAASSYQGCVFSENQNVSVTPAQPTQMLFFSDLYTKSTACLLQSQQAVTRIIQYQVTNSYNAPTPGVAVMEDFSSSPPQTTCTTSYNPTPTSCSTLGGAGIITDYLSTNACSPPDQPTCGFSIEPDHWELCNRTILGSPSYIVHWNAVWVDGSTSSVPIGTPVPK